MFDNLQAANMHIMKLQLEIERLTFENDELRRFQENEQQKKQWVGINRISLIDLSFDSEIIGKFQFLKKSKILDFWKFLLIIRLNIKKEPCAEILSRLRLVWAEILTKIAWNKPAGRSMSK